MLHAYVLASCLLFCRFGKLYDTDRPLATKLITIKARNYQIDLSAILLYSSQGPGIITILKIIMLGYRYHSFYKRLSCYQSLGISLEFLNSKSDRFNYAGIS